MRSLSGAIYTVVYIKLSVGGLASDMFSRIH